VSRHGGAVTTARVTSVSSTIRAATTSAAVPRLRRGWMGVRHDGLQSHSSTSPGEAFPARGILRMTPVLLLNRR